MRLRGGALILLVLAFVPAGRAMAQGKDPFLPPGGGTAVQGDSDQAGPDAVIPPQDPAASPDGLVRTGQDITTLLAVGLLLFALGCALRLAELGGTLPAPARRGGPASHRGAKT